MEFEQQLHKLGETGDSAERDYLARSLYSQLQHKTWLPLVVENRAYFLYYGKADKVAIAGDWTHWQIASSFSRVENTDLFYLVLEFPKTARLQYKLLVDGDFLIDPGNPRLSQEGFGVNSEFWMPSYTDQSWLTAPPVPVHHGQITPTKLESKLLGQSRDLILYTPHGAHADVPLLIFHDGGEAIHIGKFHLILDHLIAARRIPPVCALFIPPIYRNDEYALNDTYTAFTVEEALPFALDIWKKNGIEISTEPQDRCVVGASLGGLLSTMSSLRYPEQVGTCIAQSPAYWWDRGGIFRSPYFKNAPKLQVILQTGTICDARELTRLMFQRLRQAKADVEYFEYEQGHTWGNWRSNLATALLAWKGVEHPVPTSSSKEAHIET